MSLDSDSGLYSSLESDLGSRLDFGLNSCQGSGPGVSHLVVSDLGSGPGDVQQRLQSSQTGSDVLHLVLGVRRTQKLDADP